MEIYAPYDALHYCNTVELVSENWCKILWQPRPNHRTPIFGGFSEEFYYNY